jgi:hypothetical protein
MNARKRYRCLAVMLAAAAGVAGSAQAVEFDQRVKAPAMRNAAEFKAQAETFALKFNQVRDLNPKRVIEDSSLARDQFDLHWQMQQAIDARATLPDLSSLGIEGRGDGSVAIDVAAHPEWFVLHDFMAGALQPANFENMAHILAARGMNEADISKLRKFVAERDPVAAAAAETLPLTISFSRLVKKLDRMKRPIPVHFVHSYVYQRARINAEANRAWANELVSQLSPQGSRILFSSFLETRSYSIWAPEDLDAGIDDLLTAMRAANVEELARQESEGAGR